MSAADSSSLSSLSPPPSSDEGRSLTPPPRKIIIPPKNLLLKRKTNNGREENNGEIVSDEDDLAAQEAERSPSPPYEPVLADNPDIAFIVMFRSRFSNAFPKSLAHFGPQDIEKGVVDALPTPHVESLLCALLALVLNRKKPVERGHYGRALEDAIQSQKNEWPRSWEGRSPLSGGKSFNTMDPVERLSLLRALVLWSLHTSEAISGIIKENYKVSRREDDMNISLSVQPWGRDAKKQLYWLIEGQDDTNFRVYRERNSTTASKTAITASPTDWRSIAGSIDELREVADRLGKETAQASRRLSERIISAIPRFEITEEKRKRREYRMARKAQFSRPEPGFSLYEGRTRGKRMKYTFSEDDNDYDTSDAPPNARRSLRHAGAPADPARPVVTTSGRQSKPSSFLYGESASAEQHGVDANMTDADSHALRGEYGDDAGYENDEVAADVDGNRPSRGADGDRWASPREADPGRHIQGYNSVDEMDDEDEAEASSSGGDDGGDGGDEWDGGEDEYDDTANRRDESNEDEDEDEEMSEDEEDQLDGVGDGNRNGRTDKGRTREKQSLVVQLRYGKRNENGVVDGAEGTDRSGGSENIKQDIIMDGQRNENGDGGIPSFSHGADVNRNTFIDYDEQRYTGFKQPKLEAEEEEKEKDLPISNTTNPVSENSMAKENPSIPLLPHPHPHPQAQKQPPALSASVPAESSLLSASASASSSPPPPSHLPLPLPPPPTTE